jgi:hypothetical protein
VALLLIRMLGGACPGRGRSGCSGRVWSVWTDLGDLANLVNVNRSGRSGRVWSAWTDLDALVGYRSMSWYGVADEFRDSTDKKEILRLTRYSRLKRRHIWRISPT